MSIVRKNFIHVIEELPYEIDEEMYRRSELEIFIDITQKYVKDYGVEDLNAKDKKFIHDMLSIDIHDRQSMLRFFEGDEDGEEV